MPDAQRQRLLALPGADRIRAVGSGHLHRSRRRARGDVLEVWAPSTAFTGGPMTIEDDGHTGLGVVEWTLTDDAADARFHTTEGLEELPLDEVPKLVARLDDLRRRRAA